MPKKHMNSHAALDKLNEFLHKKEKHVYLADSCVIIPLMTGTCDAWVSLVFHMTTDDDSGYGIGCTISYITACN